MGKMTEKELTARDRRRDIGAGLFAGRAPDEGWESEAYAPGQSA